MARKLEPLEVIFGKLGLFHRKTLATASRAKNDSKRLDRTMESEQTMLDQSEKKKASENVQGQANHLVVFVLYSLTVFRRFWNHINKGCHHDKEIKKIGNEDTRTRR